MDSLNDLDNFLNYDFESADFLLPNPSTGVDNGFLHENVASQAHECWETDSTRKRWDTLYYDDDDDSAMDNRVRKNSCGASESKAGRERLRRERLNERFLELGTILEQGRPAKCDKSAVLDDAIRCLTQLRAEEQNLEECNKKLREEIESLKVEKNELRKEKLVLKADKEKMEQQLNSTIPPSGFIPAHPATYPVPNKLPVFPGYGYFPMWQYLPPSVRDTSQDHEHRPPAA